MLYNPCSDVSRSFRVPVFSLCLVIKIFPSLRHRYDRGYRDMFFYCHLEVGILGLTLWSLLSSVKVSIWDFVSFILMLDVSGLELFECDRECFFIYDLWVLFLRCCYWRLMMLWWNNRSVLCSKCLLILVGSINSLFGVLSFSWLREGCGVHWRSYFGIGLDN